MDCIIQRGVGPANLSNTLTYVLHGVFVFKRLGIEFLSSCTILRTPSFLDTTKIGEFYRKRWKSERSDFGHFRNHSVAKQFRFQTMTKIRTKSSIFGRLVYQG